MITYFNNAATTFPKPPEVIEAVRVSLEKPPTEPGRSGRGTDSTSECRKELADLFDVPKPSQVILTPSATYALNLVIRGLLLGRKDIHCLTTVLEHNSVLRPLEHLRRDQDLDVTHTEPRNDGRLDPSDLLESIRDNTQLIAVTQASNVTGCIQPVEEIARLAAKLEIPLLIDASQSAGTVELNYGSLPGRIFVAFAGHKGLFGPTGIGGLIVPDDLLPLTFVGGTGVQSENPLHPPELPIRHEAGTMNLSGIAGLTAGVRFVRERGVAELGRHRDQLVCSIRRRLEEFPGIRLSPLAGEDGRAGIVSFTLADWSPEELGYLLEESFGINIRSGLHCAPKIHQNLGTSPQGSIRVSVAAFNTDDDVDRLVGAIETTKGAKCTA
ncbi:MAG: aminotransferase class V-fold PLP-dependent enzyme [Pirellulales bacterium]|nr:aminotransferase class V-fold PLP-dependent enzyme [Pirellulales bacterium]